MLALFAAAAVAAFPAGSVVVGVSGTDDTSTDLVVLTPSGEREILGTLEHARGKIPKGALATGGFALVTTSEVLDGTRTVVELTTADGARKIIATGAIETQPARFTGDDVVSVLNTSADPTSFTVGGAHYRGSWITPATGALAYLAIDLDGTNRILTLASKPAGKPVALTTAAVLGQGRFRSPVSASGAVLIERERERGQAEVVVYARDKASVVRSGLAGMDPRSCGDDVVAFGNGKKHAGVVVAHLKDGALADVHELEGGGAGVVSPLACAVVGGDVVVVGWASKGASLPGELWLFSTNETQRSNETRRLLEPRVGVAVEVYGVVSGAAAVGSGSGGVR